MRILHTMPGRNWGGMEHRTLEQVRWLTEAQPRVAVQAFARRLAQQAMRFDIRMDKGLLRMSSPKLYQSGGGKK